MMKDVEIWRLVMHSLAYPGFNEAAKWIKLFAKNSKYSLSIFLFNQVDFPVPLSLSQWSIFEWHPDVRVKILIAAISILVRFFDFKTRHTKRIFLTIITYPFGQQFNIRKHCHVIISTEITQYIPSLMHTPCTHKLRAAPRQPDGKIEIAYNYLWLFGNQNQEHVHVILTCMCT